MARPQQVSNKRENEKNKSQKRLEKQKRKEARKSSNKGGSFEDMIAYVDENGRITSTPPDTTKKTEVDIESIEVSVPKKTADEVDAVYVGRVEHYNSAKGFGFIKDKASTEKYFFHISEVNGQIEENDIVTFELARGTRGMNAVKINIQVAPTSKKEE